MINGPRALVKDLVSYHGTNSTPANVSPEIRFQRVLFRLLLAEIYLESLETKVSF